MPCIHHSDLTNSTFPYISPYFLGRQKTLYITLKSPFPSFFPFSLPIVTTILKFECVIPCLVLYFYYIYVSHCLNLHFLTTNEFEHFFRYLLTIKGLLLFVSLGLFFFSSFGLFVFCQSSTQSGYKFIVGYMYCKYLLPIHSLALPWFMVSQGHLKNLRLESQALGKEGLIHYTEICSQVTKLCLTYE